MRCFYWCSKAGGKKDKRSFKGRRNHSMDFLDDSDLLDTRTSTAREYQDSKLLYPFDLYESRPALPQNRREMTVLNSGPFNMAPPLPPFPKSQNMNIFDPFSDPSTSSPGLQLPDANEPEELQRRSVDLSIDAANDVHECLLSILSESVHLLATDDRDRVYVTFEIASSAATLGTAGKQLAQLPAIDYRQSASDVFQSVPTYIMNCRRDLSLLFNVRPLGSSTSICRFQRHEHAIRFLTRAVGAAILGSRLALH
jgi:hypothetical protein